MAKWGSFMAGLTAAVLLLSGCSGTKGKAVEVRDDGQVKKAVQDTSSRLLDIMAVQGKVTEPGPSTLSCSGHSDDPTVHRMWHPWSVYDVPDGELRNAMDRLRAALPREGWKITKDGTDGSRGNAPQLVAESPVDRLGVDIRLWIEPAGSKRSSMIEATVSSECFRGQSPHSA